MPRQSASHQQLDQSIWCHQAVGRCELVSRLWGALDLATLIKSKGYPTTVAVSTIKNLLVSQYLRRGDGIIATPNSRRKERLFGISGSGRTTSISAGIKLERLMIDHYDAVQDTCVKAFVRVIAMAAAASAAADSE